MALITLKSRKEAIEIKNDTARAIKLRWAGTDGKKAHQDDVVDLEWISFKYEQIKSIEITRERKTYDDYDRPLTNQEKRDRATMMAEVRKNLEAKGLVRPQIAGNDL